MLGKHACVFTFSLLHYLGEKENSLKTDDYGRDLSSVQTLLTKQVSVPSISVQRGSLLLNKTEECLSAYLLFFLVLYILVRTSSNTVKLACSSLMLQETFDAGLQAFQQEGIANITALKDQLLAAKHIQSKAIEVRHASLMKRWNQLLANSAARKKKLLEAQEHFRKVSA